MITDAKINYNINYADGHNVYKQCLKISKKDFDYIISKIIDELEYIKVTPDYNSYEKLYLDIP